MLFLRTTDNNNGSLSLNTAEYKDLNKIANQNLIEIQEKNSDLLIFPQLLGQYYDNIEKSYIFSLHEKKMNLTTYNLMGFVGINDTKLTICSRFAEEDKKNNEGEENKKKNKYKDYFLHYMLQKVFAINILKFDQMSDEENIWDFLLYLFSYHLKKAYSQGLYKSYRSENYNDANIKGRIDIKRHISTNIPFIGKIAYTTREHSYDNAVTQLIRHTIEHIRLHQFGSGVLTCDSDTRDIVNKICFVTQNSYKKNARQKIIFANLKPVSHPYFSEYKMLQKICLQILRREKLTFGKEKDKIYGLLFDGAWLWEEYLNTILKKDFKHPENKKKEGAIQIFSGDKDFSHSCYPDFYKDDFVLDAKYKNMEPKKIASDDLHQIISYMYIQKAKIGGFIYPEKTSDNKKPIKVGTLHGYGNNVYLYPMIIPQDSDKFSNFKELMKNNEQELLTKILQTN